MIYEEGQVLQVKKRINQDIVDIHDNVLSMLSDNSEGFTRNDLRSAIFSYFLVGGEEDNDDRFVVYTSPKKEQFKIPNEVIECAYNLLIQSDEIALELL